MLSRVRLGMAKGLSAWALLVPYSFVNGRGFYVILNVPCWLLSRNGKKAIQEGRMTSLYNK